MIAACCRRFLLPLRRREPGMPPPGPRCPPPIPFRAPRDANLLAPPPPATRPCYLDHLGRQRSLSCCWFWLLRFAAALAAVLPKLQVLLIRMLTEKKPGPLP